MLSIIVLAVLLQSSESHEFGETLRGAGNFSKKLWNYDEEELWPGQKCKSGLRQSPIDIRDEDVTVDWDREYIGGPLVFTGYKAVLMTAVNNGVGVQFSSDGDTSIHPILTGGPLEHAYRLHLLHFHWLSEHAINGRKYPLELHFVHVRKDLSMASALQENNGLAIIAVMCKVKTWLAESQDDPLNEVVSLLPQLQNKDSRISGVVLDLTRLLYPGESSYYAYDGSLTSPECNEAVIWIVYKTPLLMSINQHRQFTEIIGSQNSRSLQPVLKQVVYTYRPEVIQARPAVYSPLRRLFGSIREYVAAFRTYLRRLRPAEN